MRCRWTSSSCKARFAVLSLIRPCLLTLMSLGCRGYGGRAAPELSSGEKEELIAEWQPDPLGACVSLTRRSFAVHALACM